MSVAEDSAADFVRFHAQARPAQLACVDLARQQRWTYAELDDAVERCAHALQSRHRVGHGDRVAVLGHNSGAQLIVHLACSRLGAIFVPLNWRLAAAELRVILADAEPALLLHDEPFGTTAAAITGAIPAAALAGLNDGEAPARRHAWPMPPANTPAVILYTSGSSGRPKGALLSAGNLFHTGLNYLSLGGVTVTSAALCDAPMFHVLCLVATVHSLLIAGGTVLLSPGFDVEVTLGRLGDPDLRVTHYFCVPQVAERLRASPQFDPARLRSLVALFTGGAPNPAANIRRWLDDGILMVDGYGSTEAGTVLGMPLDEAIIRRRAGASGVAAPSVQLRIVTPGGADAADGEVGELWIRGPNVIAGYWRRPEATADAFAAGHWFRSGDLGQRGADGIVTIVGRMKEMYISGGENIYPAEVEACLAEHPALKEIAVVGVPDATWGEIGVAFVVAVDGADVDAEALRAHCEARIARYKVPRRFEFRDALPRTATDKVQKALLR